MLTSSRLLVAVGVQQAAVGRGVIALLLERLVAVLPQNQH
jgi:hypothetical protein